MPPVLLDEELDEELEELLDEELDEELDETLEEELDETLDDELLVVVLAYEHHAELVVLHLLAGKLAPLQATPPVKVA